ncbi:acyltransferase family protein [Rathayibacter toxicus]|uniref:DUF418 domain-containing protein n=1 Tax=Rathayibacter toxicus TaxID=145458 RepID=A0A2S5Y831_9MICO|nr:acyltransferase family protein [Rathayibacter toxicus]PPH24659.1 DUF418 domain-containing protein [Rathayibacter toxicus]PPH58585.1 DUF418 domain-containing protein [Rathayibacter toxicus]PPH60576.1 DUF418 domain-containing protein [Rathayibacter toxicus]PPH88396.1 DUF418 domain-containing protein [Rathayibacter toxicus]PPI16090.1 DUF418 domain-containing protein [Rathayibacter toxicus]
MTATTTVPTTAALAPRLQPDRLLVPDVLRGVAIVAMLIAHAMPLIPSLRKGVIGFIAGNISDVASPLFALVMGMSATIVLARPGASGTRVIVQNLIRAAILIVLGLWLATWGSWIAIVLAYLGIVLALGTPLLLLHSRAVAVLTVLFTLVSTPLNEWVVSLVGVTTSYPPLPTELLLQWFFTGGTYRVTNLLPFFLFGALLLRHGFRRDRLLAVSAMVCVLAYPVRPILEQLTGSEGGSGSYPDTLHDLGLVLAVYVAVVLLTTVSTPSAVPVIAAAILPFRAVGSLALSVYVLQVAVVAVFAKAKLGYGVDLPAAFFLFVGGVWAAGVLWWRYGGLGPIEWITGQLTRRVPHF